jgi:hypothetical protein
MGCILTNPIQNEDESVTFRRPVAISSKFDYQSSRGNLKESDILHSQKIECEVFDLEGKKSNMFCFWMPANKRWNLKFKFDEWRAKRNTMEDKVTKYYDLKQISYLLIKCIKRQLSHKYNPYFYPKEKYLDKDINQISIVTQRNQEYISCKIGNLTFYPVIGKIGMFQNAVYFHYDNVTKKSWKIYL